MTIYITFHDVTFHDETNLLDLVISIAFLFTDNSYDDFKMKAFFD